MIDYRILRTSDALQRWIEADTGIAVPDRGRTIPCPLHEETHGESFSVWRGHDDVWRWKCHGRCQNGGDVLDYLVAAAHTPDVRTAAEVVDRAQPVPVRSVPLPSRSATAGDVAAEWSRWRKALLPTSPAAAYLERRLDARWVEVAASYNLGAVPQGWSAPWASQAWADAAHGRIALPLTLPDGAVWSAVLRAPTDRPTGDTNLARSRYIAPAGRREHAPWFGIDVAARARPDSVIVTEGPFDVLAVAAHTARIAVAVTAGAAIDRHAIDTLRRWLPSLERVTVVMDADPTGERYAGTVAALCESVGLGVRMNRLPAGMDLAEALGARVRSTQAAVPASSLDARPVARRR